MKICLSCNIEKTDDQFYSRRDSADGLMNRCRKCVAREQADYYEQNGESIRSKRRNFGRLSRYGVSESEVAKMVTDQGGVCSICQKPIDTSSHVDHDHKTGQVRAILCKECNIALGLLGDDFGNVARALDYLLEHGEQPQQPHTYFGRAQLISVFDRV